MSETEHPRKRTGHQPEGGSRPAESDREERLARRLRDNLKKRKAQQRARRTTQSDA
jgi:hypothetical protein